VIRVDEIKYGVKFQNLPMRYSFYERFTHRTYVTGKGRYAVIYDKYTQQEFTIDDKFFASHRGEVYNSSTMMKKVNNLIAEYNREDQEYLAEINDYCAN
jgi:hypothetical protein